MALWSWACVCSIAALLAATSSFTLPTSPPRFARFSWPLRCSSRSWRAAAAVRSSSAAVMPAFSATASVCPRTAARPRSRSFVLLSAVEASSVTRAESSPICFRASRSSRNR